MIRKSLALFLLGVAAGTAAYSQKTPEPRREQAPRAFAFTFDGDVGYLGVQTQEVTKENFARFGLRDVRGVAVEKVMENSPATAAGIQNGDVIVRFNGEEVTSVRKLTRLIGEVDPDHQVKVTIVRGGSEREVTVTIGKRPMPEFSNGNFEFNMPPMGRMEMPDFKNMPQMQDMPDLKNMPKGEMPQVFAFPQGEGQSFVWNSGGRQIGIGIVPLSKQLAEHFHVDGGAMVSDVRENSPAAKAGLKAGDIIVEADGKAVRNQIDLVRIINEKKEGDVQLTLFRDGNRQTVSVTPEESKDGTYFYQFGNEDGLTPPSMPVMPGEFRMARPEVTPMPMAAPAPMPGFRPGRIL